MNTTEILQALPQLPVSDRLTIAEAALRLIREESSLSKDEIRQQLKLAALGAVSDYTPGSDLIAFGELDGENFYDDEADDC
ncbi:MAG: hypothetical protein HC840_04785 [Leptolyngbyaceae cyanobacterium RM2_2_4]|nr:hypothetical protein [Leptolyngbyaceae cyanobacterium SM1_4_3]NJN57747.1 hypothetical protein [Leptolyngbyaceae cyanobacterium SL_5_9]NJO48895.1 hypothetical protein [Leptolyngbyaceae cyanobacterium RM2_2_4]